MSTTIKNWLLFLFLASMLAGMSYLTNLIHVFETRVDAYAKENNCFGDRAKSLAICSDKVVFFNQEIDENKKERIVLKDDISSINKYKAFRGTIINPEKDKIERFGLSFKIKSEIIYLEFISSKPYLKILEKLEEFGYVVTQENPDF